MDRVKGDRKKGERGWEKGERSREKGEKGRKKRENEKGERREGEGDGRKVSLCPDPLYLKHRSLYTHHRIL